MKYELNKEYEYIYINYIEYEKRRVSTYGFISLKSISLLVLSWFSQEEIPVSEVTVMDAISYKEYLSKKVSSRGKHLCKGSICNYLKAARSIWNYLLEKEEIKSNPFNEVEYPRIDESLSRNILTESQMNRLLEKLSMFERSNMYKIHLICEVLYGSGLRIGELSSLKPCDIDTEKRVIYVREGKGGTPRVAFMTGYANEVIKIYLSKARDILALHNFRKHGDKLFLSCKSTLTHETNKALREICSSLDLPVITCHGIRHSLGTHLLKAGCDMRHIQLILGHDALRSTQVYTRVNKDDLKNSIDKYHPRRWKA